MADSDKQPTELIRNRQRERMWDIAISIGLFVLVSGLFWPACGHEFLAWDDDEYVYNQPNVVNGLSAKSISWAMTAEVAANWHPLTLLSLQLDASLFGPGALGFHRTSILIHALNAVLTYWVFLTLTSARFCSVLVALAFAVHPMRVESVTWVSERKDVLSGFFFLLTVLAYLQYVRRPTVARYGSMSACFALGLSAKSMLVTTPFLLLLLDFWPLDRLQEAGRISVKRFARCALEKLPLIAMSGILCWITVLYQKSVLRSLSRIPLFDRLKNAAVSYVVYVLQTIWPLELSPYYARHQISLIQFLGALLVLLALTIPAVVWCKQKPYLLVGWCWFLGLLVPVIGIVQVGHAARADRYTYLAQVGLFVAIVWLIRDRFQESKRMGVIGFTLFSMYLVGCSVLTSAQISVWHDSRSMWQSAVARDPNSALATYYLAGFLEQDGKSFEAIQSVKKVLQTGDTPDCEALVMLAMFLADHGEFEDCRKALDQALESHPNDADLLANRGKTLSALDRWQEAANDYRRAVELNSGLASYKYYLAHALHRAGQTSESQSVLASAIRQAPNWPHDAAGRAWMMSTSPDASVRVRYWPICLAEQAILATKERQAAYFDVLAAAYANSDQFDQAISTATRAIQMAESQGQKEFAAQIRRRLESYERHEPFRDGPR